MTWWKRAEPATPPTPAVSELHRLIVEAQGDITLLYEQLERVHNRLKQRASRAAVQSDDTRPGESAPNDRSGTVASLPSSFDPRNRNGEDKSSDHLTESPPLLTKAEVQALWRQRHPLS